MIDLDPGAMDTQPAPLGGSGPSDAALSEFRLEAPREVQALLRQYMDGNVLITLAASNGQSLTTTIWTLDPQRGQIGFAADLNDPRLQRLLEADEVTAVGYLESIKVQFDVQGLLLVRGKQACVINAQYPRVVYRIQRRASYRVRPLGGSSPQAQLAHPAIPEMTLALRVLDVSLGGVALYLPPEYPDVAPGITVNGAKVSLDADTQFSATLVVHHVSVLGGERGGRRLGCEMLKLQPDTQRALQRYIDSTQKRRRMLAL
jgi:c-di-GMP-binding flagellar brake protein YcgR